MAVNQEELVSDLSQIQQTEPDTLPVDGEDGASDEGSDKTPGTEGAGTPGEEDEKGGVPYAALKAEREKWQRRMESMEAKLSKYDQLEQKLNQFHEAQQTRERQAEVPDYDENPAEYLRYRQEQLEAQQAKFNESLSDHDRQREQQAQLAQVGAAIQADEKGFISKKPDYYQALQFVRDKELERIKMAGFTEVQAMQALNQMELQIGTQMLQNEQSPAEYIYGMAKWYGYKSEDATKAEEKIDQLEAGMQASKTLGSGASKTRTVEDFDRMGLPEFDAAIKDMFG